MKSIRGTRTESFSSDLAAHASGAGALLRTSTIDPLLGFNRAAAPLAPRGMGNLPRTPRVRLIIAYRASLRRGLPNLQLSVLTTRERHH